MSQETLVDRLHRECRGRSRGLNKKQLNLLTEALELGDGSITGLSDPKSKEDAIRRETRSVHTKASELGLKPESVSLLGYAAHPHRDDEVVFTIHPEFGPDHINGSAANLQAIIDGRREEQDKIWQKRQLHEKLQHAIGGLGDQLPTSEMRLEGSLAAFLTTTDRREKDKARITQALAPLFKNGAQDFTITETPDGEREKLGLRPQEVRLNVAATRDLAESLNDEAIRKAAATKPGKHWGDKRAEHHRQVEALASRDGNSTLSR